jgi:hypothetical protein
VLDEIGHENKGTTRAGKNGSKTPLKTREEFNRTRWICEYGFFGFLTIQSQTSKEKRELKGVFAEVGK